MNTKILLIGLWGCLYQLSFGQGYSLKQCIEYADRNSGKILNAQYDVAIAQKKVNEQIGSMLPQVSATGTYNDNLKLGTTAMPAELLGGKAGETVAISMGTQHNLSAEAKLEQKIFDPTFGVALKAAKISKQQSELTLQQTREELFYNVTVTYYRTLVIQKEAELLNATLDASVQSLASTELKYSNGMAKKIDVDKIKVSCNNTRSSLQQKELGYRQSLNKLKYYMGMPVDSAIALTDTTVAFALAPEKIGIGVYNIENHVDYKLQLSTLDLYEANKRKETAGYLPTLSFNANYGYDAMRNEFNFFKPGQDWYNSYGVGLTLSVPIFDGLQRKNRIAQTKLNIKVSEENVKLAAQSLKVDLSNYEIEYNNAINNIRNEKESLDLAQGVYDNSRLAYQQGTGSSLELVQAESSLRESQSNYFNKLLDLYIARIGLEKSKGNLSEYINNIK
ncbi:MAG: TolC family protein [Breznakibacter sp.]